MHISKYGYQLKPNRTFTSQMKVVTLKETIWLMEEYRCSDFQLAFGLTQLLSIKQMATIKDDYDMAAGLSRVLQLAVFHSLELPGNA